MKSIKRGIAALLAVLLIVPNVPASAEGKRPVVNISLAELSQNQESVAGEEPDSVGTCRLYTSDAADEL